MASEPLTLKMPAGKRLDEIEWREYPHDPRYRVSEYGHAIGPRGWLLVPSRTWAGYGQYCIGKKGTIFAHRLVMAAFVGPPPSPDHDVAHWDGDKTNNHVSNLRYATRKENIADSIRLGRKGHGAKHPRAKLSEDDVRAIRARRSAGELQRQLAADFGVTQMIISKIERGLLWRDVR